MGVKSEHEQARGRCGQRTTSLRLAGLMTSRRSADRGCPPLQAGEREENGGRKQGAWLRVFCGFPQAHRYADTSTRTLVYECTSTRTHRHAHRWTHTNSHSQTQNIHKRAHTHTTKNEDTQTRRHGHEDTGRSTRTVQTQPHRATHAKSITPKHRLAHGISFLMT